MVSVGSLLRSGLNRNNSLSLGLLPEKQPKINWVTVDSIMLGVYSYGHGF